MYHLKYNYTLSKKYNHTSSKNRIICIYHLKIKLYVYII